MKKLSLFLCFLMLFMGVYSHASVAESPARIYTDFSGLEFNSDGGISASTNIKIEVTNKNSEKFGGILLYVFLREDKSLAGVEMGENISFEADEAAKTFTYKTKKDYSDAKELQIMLWNDMKELVPLSGSVTAQKAYGANGPSSQYRNFSEQPDDKIASQMPQPFNIENYSQAQIGTCDFNNPPYTNAYDAYYGDFQQGYCPGTWSIEESGGVDNSPCLKVEQSSDARSQLQLYYNDYNAKPGDWYIFSCKVKIEDAVTDAPERAFIEVYDSNGTWLDGTNSGKNNDSAKDNEWFEKKALLMVPEADSDAVEFFTLRFGGFVNTNAPEGTVTYFDDFKLTKVYFEPMDTVLVTPNYKGFIYGDGGVSDINLRAYVNSYNGYYNLNDYTLKAELMDADGKIYADAQTENVAEVTDVTFSSKVLPMNKDSYLSVKLVSKNDGSLVQKQEWTLRKREENYRPYIYFDEYNRFIKNGKAEIPLFQYAWGGIYEEYIDILKNTKTDAFTVAGTYHVDYRTPRMQKLREAMAENNIGAKLETCGYVYSNLYTGLPQTVVKKQSDVRQLLSVMCNNFKNDPQLWCYYNWDEQNPVLYGEELRWQNDIMASVDPDHPTMGVTDKLMEGRPGVFAKTADMIGVDPYVCRGDETTDLSGAGEMVRKMGTLTPNKPIYAVLQGFWFKERGDNRGPNEQEYRNMAWQALCEGAVALDSFCYTNLKENPWGDVKDIWEGQMRVYSEIDEFENVLLSTEPMPLYELGENYDWLNSMSKRYAGKSYLFAVNTQKSNKTLKVKFDGAINANEYYSKTSLTADAAGYFNLEMDEYGVAILEIEQEEYLSPHCELIRFGVSNDNHTYMVMNANGENPVINIDDAAQSIKYLVTASERSEVYINDTRVSKNGVLDITDINQITVKIASEDGNHTTTKTYSLVKQ